MKYADVIIFEVSRSFLYSIPENLTSLVVPGSGVTVPISSRRAFGIVASVSDEKELPDSITIKNIAGLFEEGAVLSPDQLQLSRWISEYYIYPWVKVLEVMFPSALRKKGERFFHATVKQCTKNPKDQAKLTTSMQTTLNHIAASGSKVSFNRLSAALSLPATSLNRHINSLKKNGLIYETFDLPQPGHKSVTIIQCDNFSPAGIKGRVQRQILEYMREHNPVQLATLRRTFSDSSIKALIDKGLLSSITKKVRRIPYEDLQAKPAKEITLSPQQDAALKTGLKLLAIKTFSTLLLHGVTSSGKTEVYTRLAEKAVEAGRSVIILIPEIGLTSVMAARFKAVFKDRVFIHHSKLSDGERLDEWRAIRKTKGAVVIGARSAVFSPVTNLGLIIADEEHDTSYKQESGLKYNARDMAIVRARTSNALVVLGSATPSVESYHNARQGKYHYSEMTTRANRQTMPEIEIVDMRRQKGSLFSKTMMQSMRNCFERGEQVLVFVNRRGFANSIVCTDCGLIFKCINCNISQTFHKYSKTLSCHYCGYKRGVPDTCPQCRSTKIKELGFGTEKVFELLSDEFPQIKAGRMDSDTTQKKMSHLQIIKNMEEGETSLLVGTQMITKGHHLPNITLVCVVLADLSLSFPDFRAAERTFQVLTQVAGRAGRGEKTGKVIIQTMNPDHYSIDIVKRHDYECFYQKEIDFRKELRYPPFSRLAVVNISGENDSDTARLAHDTALFLRKNSTRDPMIFGPTPALLYRLKNKYRWQILVKSESSLKIRKLLTKIKRPDKKEPVQVSIDIDPTNFL